MAGLDPPGVFTYRDGVAVIQLFFFAIFICFAIVLCLRHGFRRAEGWVILITFSILRLLGASFQLASIHNQTSSVYGGALICEGIGLAPLTLLNIGLFGRLNKWINKLNAKVLSAISLVAIAGLVLGIYGGTESAESPTLGTNALLQASVICFAVAYVAFVGLFFVFLSHWNAIPHLERGLLVCFAFCSPFMVIRLLYSILPDFIPSLRDNFSALFGNVTIYLFMAVLEEIVIVACYIFAGMRLDPLPAELRTPSMKQQRREKKAREQEKKARKQERKSAKKERKADRRMDRQMRKHDSPRVEEV